MELISTPQVAKQLGVSAATVRRIIAAGAIETVQVGRQIRIEPRAIESFIERNRRCPKASDSVNG